MPLPSFPNLSTIDPKDPQAILDALAKIQRELNWLLQNLDDLNIRSLKADAIHGGTLTLGGPNNGNGQAVVFDSSGNERARIDNTGVSVFDASFLLKDSITQVPSVVGHAVNLVRDHSFELVPRTGNADQYQTFAVDTNKTNLQSIFYWRPTGAARILSTRDTGLPQLARFDLQAAVIRHYNQVLWRQYCRLDWTVGLAGPYAVSAWFAAFEATTVNTTAKIELWAVDADLTRLQKLATAQVSINASEKYKYKRCYAVGQNLPANTAYLEITIFCDPDTWVLCDGVQLVPLPYPETYNPESNVWPLALALESLGSYIPPSVRIQRIYGQSIATSTVTPIVWEGRAPGYRSGGMWDPSQSDRSRIYIPERGKYLIVANIRWASNPNGFRMASIYKSDGSPIAKTQVPASHAGSSATTSLQVSTIYHFEAGDWFQIMAWQNSGGTLDISPEGEATHMVAMKIGA